jgi:hypothetical protein
MPVAALDHVHLDPRAQNILHFRKTQESLIIKRYD